MNEERKGREREREDERRLLKERGRLGKLDKGIEGSGMKG